MFGRVLVFALCIVAVVSPDAALPGLPAPIPEAVAAVTEPAASPAAHPVGKPAADPYPARLVISKIGVDATIEARGLDASRNLLTPKDFNDVAWYNLGPAPGQPGNALVNGHVDWWTGSGVFTRVH